MAVVQAKSVRNEVLKNKKNPNRELWATVCYYYPQYTLEEASKLPYRDLSLLLNTAKKLRASDYLMLLNISSAPHSEKGKGVKKLYEQLKKDIE